MANPADSETKRPRRLATIEQACEYGNVSRTKVYRKMRAGDYKAYKRGGETMVDLNSIDDDNASLPEWRRPAPKSTKPIEGAN